MSSAYINNLNKLLDSGKSLILYSKHSSGPKMEPSETTDTICNVLDTVSLNSTNCSLSAGYLLNKLYAVPRIP